MSLDIYLLQKETCPNCGHVLEETEVHWQNITHNLVKMAGEAGIYYYIWRPEENGIKKASQLIEPLKKGVALMEEQPDRFKGFNASNGWGTYQDFVPWIKKLIAACEDYPEARVTASK